jgi:hypothetical protein
MRQNSEVFAQHLSEYRRTQNEWECKLNCAILNRGHFIQGV